MNYYADEPTRPVSTMTCSDGRSIQRVRPPVLVSTLSAVQGKQQDPARFVTRTAEQRQQDTYTRIQAAAGRGAVARAFVQLYPRLTQTVHADKSQGLSESRTTNKVHPRLHELETLVGYFNCVSVFARAQCRHY